MAGVATELRQDALSEWRTGWPYVLCAVAGLVAGSSPTYSTGLFMQPLSAEFGWSRADVSSSLMVLSVGMFLLAPFGGRLIDRWGVRRSALIGAPLCGLALASVGLSGPSLWTWWLAWAVYSACYIFVGPQVWAAAISARFERSRGLALSVGLAGTGLGAIVWPGMTVYLIEQFGWRIAYHATGLSIAIGLFIFSWLFVKRPSGLPRRSESARTSPNSQGGMTLGEALRTRTFWVVSVGVALIAAAVAALLIHLPAMLTDKGMSPERAAGVMTILGPVVIASRIGGGYLLDRIHGRAILGALFLAPAIAAIILYHYDGGYLLAVCAVILIGVPMGVEGDIIAFMLGRYFGLQNFGSIYGASISIFSIGFGCSPYLMGTAYGYYGSYDLILLTIGFSFLALPAITLLLRPYPEEFSTKC